MSFQSKLKKEWIKLTQLVDKADRTWENCKLKLQECKQFQSLHLKMIEVSAWLENKKAYIEAEDVGDSYADVDGILRKQQDFDRALQQQQKSFVDLKSEAAEVTREGHFKRGAIEKNIGELEQKMEALKDKNATRMEELQMTKKCFLLLRKINQMRSWWETFPKKRITHISTIGGFSNWLVHLIIGSPDIVFLHNLPNWMIYVIILLLMGPRILLT